MDYPGIVLSLLAVMYVLVFLTVFPDNQVCIFHSVGRFSCGLGRPTIARNRIFGVLVKKLGGSLTPTDMLPVTGVVSCIQMETHVKPTEADL